jgi:hypothetical protein
MPKKRAPPPKSAPKEPACRVVAVHRSVINKLAGWETSTGWVQAATDFRAVIDLLEDGDIDAANQQLRHLYRDAIGEGVREYGKNQKGGTLRLFVLQEYQCYFLLSAGLKKHNKEAAEADPARKRARAIKQTGQQSSKADYERILGDSFDVKAIPTHLKQQRGQR